MLVWLTLPDIIRVSYLLTVWSRVFLEKLTVSQPVKNFLALYGNLRFITAFKISHTPTLFRATSFKFIPPVPLPEVIVK